ncbi:MAG TPA: hypothetical protein VL424_08820, partial [Pararobbsia sp.]|nr:hypothetical protein [Pararobbsia sp.]
MPKITILIANPKTPYTDPNNGKTTPSTFGHVWYQLENSDTDRKSYGFAPHRDYHGQPFAPGDVVSTDTGAYGGHLLYIRKEEITKAQYDTLKTFSELALNAAPGSTVAASDVSGKRHTFTLHYNGLTNSCIDYVWKALDIAGINRAVFEGALLPTTNMSSFDY